VRPELPRALDAVVLRALSPDPEHRFATAGEFLDALVAAASVAPDPAALAAAVREVPTGEPASRMPLESTLPPAALPPERLPAGGPARTPVAPHRTRRKPALWALGGGVAALAVAVAWTLAIPESSEPSGDPAPIVHAPVASAAGTLSPPAPAEPIREPDVPPEGPVVGPVPAPGSPPGAKPGAASSLAGGKRRDVSIPGVARDLTLTVIPEQGSVHVDAAGRRGLAPVTAPLAEGPTLVTLRGGKDGALTGNVRVVRSGDRVTASFGAPPGAWYAVRCGGREVGNTPAFGVEVSGRLPCRLLAPGGDGIEFALEVGR